MKLLNRFKPTRKKVVSFTTTLLVISLSGLAFLQLTANRAKADTLIGFNEGNGSTVYDENGNATGTITGATWKTEDLCVVGNCLYFDGSDWISFGDDADYDFVAAADFTIQFWFRHGPATATEVIIQKYEGTDADGGYRIQMESDGDISFGVDDANGGFADDNIVSTAANYDNNKWHHVSAVKDGTTGIYLYIDGIQVASDTTIGSIGDLTNNDTFYIGDSTGADGGDEYIGFLDEVKIYTTSARTETEIKSDIAGATADRGTSASFGPDNSFLSDGLVGFWKMDESGVDAEGETITDYSGNGNSGTLYGDNSTGDNGTGMDCTAAGKFGTGCDFDGTDDYARVDDNSELDLSRVTMSAWIYPTNNSGRRMAISKRTTSGSGAYFIGTNSGTIEFFPGTADGTIHSSGQTAPLNTWTHIAATYDGASIMIYKNGDQVKKVSLTGSMVNSAHPLDIGHGFVGTDYYFLGKIDEARIYNRVLTPAEIQSLYNWAPGPVGYWKMDENTGTNINDSSGFIPTAVTFSGSPTWSVGKYGSAVFFDGTDFANGPTDSYLNILGNLTLSTWIYIDPGISSQDNIFSYRGTGGGEDATNYILRVITTSGNDIQYGHEYNDARNEETTTFNTDLSTNTWYHLSLVRDNTAKTAKLFVNGVQTGATFNYTNVPWRGEASNLRIANSTSAGSRGFDGRIDDLRIYNYARTQSQIIENMNAGHPAPGSPVGSAIGQWSFDQGTDNTCLAGTNDVCNTGSGGSALDGAQTGMAVPATATSGWQQGGKFSKALAFDGSSDFVQITDNNALDFGTSQDFTYSLWIKSSQAPVLDQWPQIISKWPVAGDKTGYEIVLHDSTDDARWGGGVIVANTNYSAYGKTDVADGNWHHLVLMRDGSTIRTYEDGRLANENTSGVTTDVSNSANFRFGATNSGGYFYNGLIDEVKLFRSALTSDQVKLLYNQSAAAVWGASSTDSSGNPSWSANDEYCPPGQGTACTAPVGEWKLNENSGSSANDTGSAGVAGSFAGNTAWTSGRFGSGLQFDGTNDGLRMGDNDAFSVTTTNELTVGAWIKPSVVDQTQYFVSKYSSGNYEWNMQVSSGGAFGGGLNSTAGGGYLYAFSSDSNIYLSAKRWYYAAFTVNSTTNTLNVYLDGMLVASDTTTSGSVANGTAEVRLGIDGGSSNDYNGLVDEVRIYNYVRTPAQIAWEFNRGAPVAYWTFDECSGDQVYDTTPKADPRTTGYTGTITPGDTTGDNDTVGTCGSGTSTEMWNDGTSGKRNASLGFDGTNDTVNAGDINELDGVSQFTLSAWVKNNTLGQWDSILTKSVDANNRIVMAVSGSGHGDSDDVYLNVSDGADVRSYTTGNILSTAVWNHWVLVFDGTQGTECNRRKFYFNGKEQTLACVGGAPAATDNNSANVVIGSSIDGQIDDVQIFNYALTAQQVRNVYNGGAVRFGP